MPEVTDEELGRRMFQLQKEKAIENVIEIIRSHLGKNWNIFTSNEKMIFRDILGKTWVSVERSLWEQCAFSRLTSGDVEDLIQIGDALRNGKMTEKSAIDGVMKILTSSTGD